MTSSPLHLDIVLPVFNEAEALPASVLELHRFLSETEDSLNWQITIADNASTDDTAFIAGSLAATLTNIRVVHLAEKGRGRALKRAWTTSSAQVLAYMDIDLSTDLRALSPLIAPLLTGHSDVAIGSRLKRGSRVVRSTTRETLSRGYNLLLHTVLGAAFSDAQCGFKAVSASAAHRLLPLVADEQWFFDTELLVLAERCGLRIAEVAVDWYDDPKSTVDVAGTVKDDLKGIARMGWPTPTRDEAVAQVRTEIGRLPLQAAPPLTAQLVRFGLIGVASTIAYSLLFLTFHSFLGAQWANFLALAISAVANTMVNRRLTFGVKDPATAGVHLVQGLLVFAATWALTSGALSMLTRTSEPAGPWETLLLLTGANAVATVLRFLVLRLIFRPKAEAVRVESRITRRELMGA